MSVVFPLHATKSAPVRGRAARPRESGTAFEVSGGPMAAEARPAESREIEGTSLLLLQCEPDGHRPQRHGPAAEAGVALRGLSGLQLALLRGADCPVEELRRLAEIAERLGAEHAGEAGSLCRAISVRIHVELARRMPVLGNVTS
jgi:hypothetical protein